MLWRKKEKKKLYPYLIPYTKVNSREIKDFKTYGKTTKLTKENVGEYFCDLEVESFFFLIIIFIYLFIYFWLSWIFVAACGLSLVAVSRGYSPLRCTGFSLRWLLLLRSTGSRHAGFSSCGARAQ